MFSYTCCTLSNIQAWFRARYYFTTESVGVTIIVAAVWILSYYLMSVFSNIASSLSPDNAVYPQLPDVGFMLLPQINTLWLTDLFDAILVLPTILLIITHRKPAYVGITWMLTSTLCNIERVASVAITSFPDPRSGCEKVSDSFLSKVSAHKCGDCMFSGHTVLFVICACAWTTYTPARLTIARTAIIVTVWSLVATGSAVVIMNRAHYTVDVLVAWYVGIGNWYTVQYLWKEHCLCKGYLKSVNWPESRLADEGYRMVPRDVDDEKVLRYEWIDESKCISPRKSLFNGRGAHGRFGSYESELSDEAILHERAVVSLDIGKQELEI
ncbi:PAP2 superfamily C-terminal-domain-containing protein [Fennellomyces sp. T-0311]|nr:PAP2 superfamily C-terminal-domain-containing protein [Fennellomyces sp. T-0311]